MKIFYTFFNIFSKSQILKMHTVCQHVLSAITGDQCMRFGGATPSSIIRSLRGRGCTHKTHPLIPHDGS
ncbi:hypothetical protein AB205_0212380 [Aquarana catesbeiana]|uniref:Uncharacterized protein n=1 Tax=Aquarana catesbeiana TaxID=8400 RepID=A0A2G9Q1M7_AQUCT|nr:hypothetical protein AB205_0212380 [Aquarana catesbeiana]